MEFTPIENTLSKVEEFHNAFGIVNFTQPTIIKDIAALRISLLQEELQELYVALQENDPVEVLDALTDLQYVLDGAFLQFGMAHLKQMAFDEVHRSNMSKLGEDGKPIYREDGKVLKGPNYFKPNLAQFIQKDVHSFELKSVPNGEEPSSGEVARMLDTAEYQGCGSCETCGCCK